MALQEEASFIQKCMFQKIITTALISSANGVSLMFQQPLHHQRQLYRWSRLSQTHHSIMNLQQLFCLHTYPFDTLFEFVIDEEWQILWGLRVEVDEELKAARDHLLELLVLVEWLMQEMVEPIIQVQKILQASEHKLWHLRIGLFSRHDAWKQNSKLYSSARGPLVPNTIRQPMIHIMHWIPKYQLG